jgi:hypothetical protein
MRLILPPSARHGDDMDQSNMLTPDMWIVRMRTDQKLGYDAKVDGSGNK